MPRIVSTVLDPKAATIKYMLSCGHEQILTLACHPLKSIDRVYPDIGDVLPCQPCEDEDGRESTYRTVRDDRASCPNCKQHPRLLFDNVGDGMRNGPSFYVCSCGFIGQVGVGPVRPLGDV